MGPPVGRINEEWTWTLWDRFDLRGPLTLRELLDIFPRKYGLEISMCSSGATVLYSFFMPKAKLDQRLDTE